MPQWRKSSYSNGTDGADCLELAAGSGVLLLRESDEPDRVLTLSSGSLTALLHLLREPRAVPQWQKSSFSGPADGSQCVELARDESRLLLRESDDPNHTLTLARQALGALLRRLSTAARAGW